MARYRFLDPPETDRPYIWDSHDISQGPEWGAPHRGGYNALYVDGHVDWSHGNYVGNSDFLDKYGNKFENPAYVDPWP